MGKRNNLGGKEFVADRFIELMGSNYTTPALSNIKNTIYGQTSKKDIDSLKDEIFRATSDGIITPSEKLGLRREWANLESSYYEIKEEFDKLGTDVNKKSFNDLTNVITALSALLDKIFDDMESDYSEDDAQDLTNLFVSAWNLILACSSIISANVTLQDKYSLDISGSREITDSITLNAVLTLLDNGTLTDVTNQQSGTDFTWSKPNDVSFAPRTGKSVKIMLSDMKSSPDRFALRFYKVFPNSIGNGNDQNVEHTVFVDIIYGTVTQYLWSIFDTFNESIPSGGWSDKEPTEVMKDMFLWRRTSNDLGNSEATRQWTYYRETGPRGQDGIPGEPAKALSIELDKNQIQYYADDVIVDPNEKITATVERQGTSDSITVKWAGGQMVITSAKGTVEIPATALNGITSLLVTAECGLMTRYAYVNKRKLIGSLGISSDKDSVRFYADNVPHDSSEIVEIAIESENYSETPTLLIDNVPVTVVDNKYSLPVSEFVSKNEIVATVKNSMASRSITIRKVMDNGHLSLYPEKMYFGYFADNEPHNSAETIKVNIQSKGFSTYPTLIVDNVVTEYSKGENPSYDIYSTALKTKDSVPIKVTIGSYSDEITISKMKDIPSILISLSSQIAEYSYDNVAISSDIGVSVTYAGLMHMPSLKAGDTPITLDSNGNGTIPISLMDSVSDKLEVKAWAQNQVGYEVKAYIIKEKRRLDLSLSLTAYQFKFDTKGNATPASITVMNTTRNLSNPSLATLRVGGAVQTWSDDNTFTILPSMMTGNYLDIEISYGTEKASTIISKVADGRAEIIEYSKTKSFKIYPDDEYYFVFNEAGLEYNGEAFAWIVPWSSSMPEQTGSDYVWRRSKTDPSGEWEYTRITGAIGEDGKQGGGTYLGHYTSAPTEKPDGTAIIDGDYFLDVSTPGSPLPYRYKDGQWVLVTTSDSDWSAIASATMDDVNSYGGALLSTSAYYGFFQNLSANNAFIEKLGAQSIKLNEQGEIKSENWDETNGAEGFQISADGNATFNNGTWRGSFANGLSFIPPTHVRVDKNMTQKEAYQLLKKAGISEGHYSSGPLIAGSDAYAEVPNISFSCMEYDSSRVSMNIPIYIFDMEKNLGAIEIDGKTVTKYAINSIFGYIGYVAPITDELWLIGKANVKENTSGAGYIYDVDGLYLLTLGKLQEFLNSNVDTSLSIEDDLVGSASKYLKKLDTGDLIGININSNKIGDKSYYQIVPYIEIFHINDEVRLLAYSVSNSSYSFCRLNTTTLSIDDVHTITATDINGNNITNSTFFQFLTIPMVYSFKSDDGYYYLIGYHENPPAGEWYKHFSVFRTQDFLTFKEVLYADISSKCPNGAVFVGLVVKDGKAYTIIDDLEDDADVRVYKFCSFDMATGAVTTIPYDSYWDVKKSGHNSSADMQYKLGSLRLVGNKIFGTFNGSFAFSYDTDTGYFKDVGSVIAKSTRIKTLEYGYPYVRELLTGSIPEKNGNNSYGSPTFVKNLLITEISYDEKMGKLFMPMLLPYMDNGNYIFIGLYMDPDTYECTIFSPSGFGNFVLPINTTSGYLTAGNRRTFVIGNTIFLGGYDLSSASLDFRNISYREIDEMLASGGISSMSFFVNTIGTHPLLQFGSYSNYAIYGGIYSGRTDFNERLCQNLYDEAVVHVDALAPIQGVTSIDIYETQDKYMIGITDISMGLSNSLYALGSLSPYVKYMFTLYFDGKTHVEPFLVIDKNSTDTVGASFVMDFPAQITTKPGIGDIVGRQIIPYQRGIGSSGN